MELLDFLQGGLGTAHNSALSACEKAPVPTADRLVVWAHGMPAWYGDHFRNLRSRFVLNVFALFVLQYYFVFLRDFM